MLNITRENGTLHITADAEIFIIPNSASHMSLMTPHQERSYKEYNDKLRELNGLEPQDPDWDVIWCQVWICSDDLKTDNLFNHGAHIKVNGENCWISSQSKESLPHTLIRFHKEGDTFTLKIPCRVEYSDRCETPEEDYPSEEAVLELHLTTAQLKYRYSRFGPFEDALHYVLA